MGFNRVNLYYLYTAAKLNITDYRIYEKILSNRKNISNLGDREKGSLYYLVKLLLDAGCGLDKLDNFYYSYIIPHIGKEFDLLKIDNEKILNIELKSENVGLNRIKEQLVCNYKYLKYLSKESHLFTFVSDEKIFYKLDKNQNLIQVKNEDVIKVINSFSDIGYLDIDNLFKTGDFLVSPNVNPEKFINNQYFLTTQQEYIKNKLLSLIDKNNIFKLTGEAGTGKTLLLFDIAKELVRYGKVLIINCNKINPSHQVLNEAFRNILILSQDELLEKEEEIYYSEYILLDESQRMNKKLWETLNKYIFSFNKKVIFSLDPRQVLTKEEINSNYNNCIDKLEPVKFKLSNKIRINNSIKDFTYRLFDLSLIKYPLDLSNINIHYASNQAELKRYFELYQKEYTYIAIPNTNYESGLLQKVNINDVVGKDYENVLMVIDSNYFYNNQKLSSYNSKKNDYLYLKILYQGLSRTREKLVLIVYRNQKLFKEILKNVK